MASFPTSPGLPPPWPGVPVDSTNRQRSRCGRRRSFPALPVDQRGVRRGPVDLAARIERVAPRLVSSLARAPAILEFTRAVNAAPEPGRVAGVLVSRAAAWLPGTCPAVVEPGPRGDAVVLAGSGLGPREESPVRAVGSWVLARSRVWSSADLGRDGRVAPGPAVSAVGLPLTCRMRTVAALIVLDGRPAAVAPRLPPALLRALRMVLEPAAIALDNARRIRRAERLAGTDDLTGLCNLRALTDTLRRETARAVRTGQPLSLIVIDLDGFKRINDGHGHPRGSRALVEVAALLRDSVRTTDFAARLGGDEFAVLLPDTGRHGAVTVGDRLRARIADRAFLRREGLDVRLTASVGAATVSGPAAAGAMIELADNALYQAKAGGGNRTECIGPGSQPGNERRDTTFDALLSFERSGH